MLRQFLAASALYLFASLAFAGVDANVATEAELDGVKGIGPGTTRQILAERKKGAFKDWDDFIGRVDGVGDKRAELLSEAGLTIGGQPYRPAAPTKK